MKARIKRIPKRQKRERSREDARRFASNVSTGIVVIGAIIGIVIVANRWARHEDVSGVRIVGRHILDSAEVLRYAGVVPGTPLASVDLDSIERRVMAHPFIARASAYRAEQGMLTLEIAERVPVAMVLLDGSPAYLDSLGVLLPYRFSSAGFDLPLVAGVGRRTADSATGPIDSALAGEALSVLAAVRAYDDALYRQVSELRRDSLGQYTIVTTDGAIAVRAGSAAEVPARLRKLERFLATVAADRGAGTIASVDLRWRGQVVVRWRAGAM